MKTLTKDTIGLLKECTSEIKMAVAGIGEVIDVCKIMTLKQALIESKNKHEKIGKEIERILSYCDEEAKEPPKMEKMMSWMKINLKMTADPTDSEAANLIYDGCDMGIKSLYEYLNCYKDADEDSVKITHCIIDEEEKLKSILRNFL